jgi:hypothetical protein
MTDQQDLSRHSENAAHQAAAKEKAERPLDAAACSLPKYLKSCRPPFFAMGGQIFGRCAQGDALALDIRGWGRLTNASSKLTEDKACAIQDEFAEWVCKTLNAAAENTPDQERKSPASDGSI